MKNIINPKKQLIKSKGAGIWCFEDFKILDDSNFKLNTIEFKSITFNLKTGKVLSKKYMENVNKKSIILYGDIDKDYEGDNLYKMQADYVIQGKKSKYNLYHFYSEIDLNAKYKLIIINDGKYDSTLIQYQFEGLK